MFGLKRVYYIILFLFIPFFCFQNTAAAKQPKPIKVSLQLNWKYQFEFAGFLVAKELGFYRQNGLDVTIKELKNPSSDTVDDVLEGKSDFGVSGSYLIFRAAKGAKIKAIIPILQHSPAALMVLKTSGINTLKQLNGKKISIADRYVFVRAMLKANNVKYIKYPPEYFLDDLIDKKIDAMVVYTSNEPFRAKEKGVKIKVFKPSDYGFDGYGDMLFTSERFAQKHRGIVEKFKKATLEGWKYALEHEKNAVELIYNRYNTLKKTKKALYFEASVIKRLSGYKDNNFSKFDAFRIKSIAQIYRYVMPGKYDMQNLDNFIFNSNKLTRKEIYYLLKKRSVKICVFPNFYPLEAFKGGKYIGITSVILDRLINKLPVPVKIVTSKTNTEVMDKVMEGKCDIKSIVLKDYAPCAKMLFVIPYIRDYFVVITTVDKSYLKSIRYFKNKLFVVTQNGYLKYLKDKYPHLEIKLEHKSLKGIVKQLKDGKIYGLIVPSIIANTIVKKFGYQYIKVNSKVYNSSITFGLGVSKTEPQLFNIVKKIFSGISKSDLNRLLMLYDLRQSKGEDNSEFMKIAAILFSILTIILMLLFIIYKIKNNQLKQLLDASISGIAIFKNNRLVVCNKPALSRMGYESLDEVKGKHIVDFVASEYKEGFKRAMKDRNMKAFELYLVKKDKTQFPSLGMGTKINKSTRIVSFIDLTDMKEAQAKLEELNKTLEERIKQEVEKSNKQQLILLQQARYSQMGEVISMIAHQWRQPLNILSVLLQKLQIQHQFGTLNDETIDDVLEKANVQIQQMSYIIDEFRNFFKPNQEMKKFNLSKVIDEIISTLQPLFIDLNIYVELDLDTRVEINGFRSEFKQALINLINNAKDVLKNKKDKKVIKISLKDYEKEVKITVADNGGGIRENILNKIFEPYFSTKSQDGTGIGLYITKIIIERHMSGKIEVANSKEGAIFKITIPKLSK